MYHALAIKIVKQLVLAVLDAIAIAAYDPTAHVFFLYPESKDEGNTHNYDLLVCQQLLDPVL